MTESLLLIETIACIFLMYEIWRYSVLMDAAELTEKEFWKILDTIANEYMGNLLTKAHQESLLKRLSNLSNDQLRGFESIHRSLKTLAETADHSEAVYIFCNGCGDDDYSNFLSSLIAMGKEMFYGFLEDTEATLLNLKIPSRIIESENFAYLADTVYGRRMGMEGDIFLDSEIVIEFDNSKDPMEGYSEDSNHLQKKYPRLFEKYWKLEI